MSAAIPRPLFLARHGQPEWNLEGRKQGQLDSPLTSDGIAQAERLGENLAGLALQRIHELGDGPALIVSHEMIGRMLVKNLCGLTPEAALAHKHPHGVVFRWDAGDPGALATVGS